MSNIIGILIVTSEHTKSIGTWCNTCASRHLLLCLGSSNDKKTIQSYPQAGHAFEMTRSAVPSGGLYGALCGINLHVCVLSSSAQRKLQDSILRPNYCTRRNLCISPSSTLLPTILTSSGTMSGNTDCKLWWR